MPRYEQRPRKNNIQRLRIPEDWETKPMVKWDQLYVGDLVIRLDSRGHPYGDIEPYFEIVLAGRGIGGVGGHFLWNLETGNRWSDDPNDPEYVDARYRVFDFLGCVIDIDG